MFKMSRTSGLPQQHPGMEATSTTSSSSTSLSARWWDHALDKSALWWEEEEEEAQQKQQDQRKGSTSGEVYHQQHGQLEPVAVAVVAASSEEYSSSVSTRVNNHCAFVGAASLLTRFHHFGEEATMVSVDDSDEDDCDDGDDAPLFNTLLPFTARITSFVGSTVAERVCTKRQREEFSRRFIVVPPSLSGKKHRSVVSQACSLSAVMEITSSTTIRTTTATGFVENTSRGGDKKPKERSRGDHQDKSHEGRNLFDSLRLVLRWVSGENEEQFRSAFCTRVLVPLAHRLLCKHLMMKTSLNNSMVDDGSGGDHHREEKAPSSSWTPLSHLSKLLVEHCCGDDATAATMKMSVPFADLSDAVQVESLLVEYVSPASSLSSPFSSSTTTTTFLHLARRKKRSFQQLLNCREKEDDAADVDAELHNVTELCIRPSSSHFFGGGDGSAPAAGGVNDEHDVALVAAAKLHALLEGGGDVVRAVGVLQRTALLAARGECCVSDRFRRVLCESFDGLMRCAAVAFGFSSCRRRGSCDFTDRIDAFLASERQRFLQRGVGGGGGATSAVRRIRPASAAAAAAVPVLSFQEQQQQQQQQQLLSSAAVPVRAHIFGVRFASPGVSEPSKWFVAKAEELRTVYAEDAQRLLRSTTLRLQQTQQGGGSGCCPACGLGMCPAYLLNNVVATSAVDEFKCPLAAADFWLLPTGFESNEDQQQTRGATSASSTTTTARRAQTKPAAKAAVQQINNSKKQDNVAREQEQPPAAAADNMGASVTTTTTLSSRRRRRDDAGGGGNDALVAAYIKRVSDAVAYLYDDNDDDECRFWWIDQLQSVLAYFCFGGGAQFLREPPLEAGDIWQVARECSALAVTHGAVLASREAEQALGAAVALVHKDDDRQRNAINLISVTNVF